MTKKHYNINTKVRISSNERYNFKPNSENVPQNRLIDQKIKNYLKITLYLSKNHQDYCIKSTKKLKISSKLRDDIDKKLKITSQMNCNIDKKSQNIPQKYTMTSTKNAKNYSILVTKLGIASKFKYNIDQKAETSRTHYDIHKVKIHNMISQKI